MQQLDEALFELRRVYDVEIQVIENFYRTAVDVKEAVHRYKVDKLLADSGKVRCPKCDGTGAIERLDAGHMRRFQLREWNGCKNCGGDNERKGKGYMNADPVRSSTQQT